MFLCTLLVLTPITAAAQDTVNAVLVGTGPGGGLMRELSAADGSELASATPFGPTFNGGVRVASGDISGDGTDDFIVGSGFGAGQVSVLDGDDLSVIWTFAPFGPSFAGGVYVASGDIDGDSRADVIVGEGVGGGRVRVYSGADHSLIVTRTPFGSILGGVTVAAGDITGDTRADLVVGTAFGGTLLVLDGVTGSTVMTKTPFGSIFLGGVNVAAGDVNGDGRTDAIAAPGLVLREVKVYNGHDGNLLTSFTPYPTGGIGGVTVAAGRVDGDLHDDIITGPGPLTQPRVKIFSGANPSVVLADFLGFNATFLGGVYVAAVHEAAGGPTFTSADNTTFQVGRRRALFDVTTSGGSPALSFPTAAAGRRDVHRQRRRHGHARTARRAEGTGGVYPLTFTADDGVNPPVMQAFTLTVNESPEITSADNVTFNAGRVGTPSP